MKINYKTAANINFNSANRAVPAWLPQIILIKDDSDIFTTDTFSRSFKRKEDKLEIHQYRELDEIEKETIRRETPLHCYFAAIQNTAVAAEYKNFLDEIYGKDNYVFISIGTSPSLIGKAFECMGIETKYLPMSGLKDKNLDIEEFCANNELENYTEFMKRQNLTKERISRSKKHFIFCDYADTGKTLERFQRLMELKFGIDGKNVHYRKLNEDLKNTNLDEETAESYVKSYLELREAEIYSAIDHLGYFMTDATSFEPECLTRHGMKDVKYFNFNVMDRLNATGMLKENRLNRNSL